MVVRNKDGISQPPLPEVVAMGLGPADANVLCGISKKTTSEKLTSLGVTSRLPFPLPPFHRLEGDVMPDSTAILDHEAILRMAAPSGRLKRWEQSG